MDLKYLARLFTVVLLLGSCTPPIAQPDSSPRSGPESAASPSPRAPSERPSLAVTARVMNGRSWYLVPDALVGASPIAGVLVAFDGDPSSTGAFARLRPGDRQAQLVAATGPNQRTASFDLHGLAPGEYAIDIVERLAGGDAVVATHEFKLSAPEYVVWTLDFEGDASADSELANTAAIADGFGVPMTIMWNPRVWTTVQVGDARAAAMLAWTKDRASKGDEVSLHLHMWTDFVRASGLVPRTAPNWAGRSDGYDVPMTAFNEAETKTMLDFSLRLMSEHGLPRPTTFRAGGQFASAANLRALAGSGFVADASAVPAGGFGRLVLPWTLAADAQPYRPAPDDANAVGALPLLEAPTIGGNTYAYDLRTIQPIVRTDLSLLAPAGEVARARRAITLVSHPGTIVPAERAAIESLFSAFAPLRYDRDAGPVRFITLAQLATAYGP